MIPRDPLTYSSSNERLASNSSGADHIPQRPAPPPPPSAAQAAATYTTPNHADITHTYNTPYNTSYTHVVSDYALKSSPTRTTTPNSTKASPKRSMSGSGAARSSYAPGSRPYVGPSTSTLPSSAHLYSQNNINDERSYQPSRPPPAPPLLLSTPPLGSVSTFSASSPPALPSPYASQSYAASSTSPHKRLGDSPSTLTKSATASADDPTLFSGLKRPPPPPLSHSLRDLSALVEDQPSSYPTSTSTQLQPSLLHEPNSIATDLFPTSSSVSTFATNGTTTTTHDDSLRYRAGLGGAEAARTTDSLVDDIGSGSSISADKTAGGGVAKGAEKEGKAEKDGKNTIKGVLGSILGNMSGACPALALSVHFKRETDASPCI